MNKDKVPMPFAVVSFVLVAFGGDNDFWNRCIYILLYMDTLDCRKVVVSIH